jgi:hypothetical protein
MPEKKKADLDEKEETAETVYSPDVLEVVELYKQVAGASADAILVPTSEDVRAMALTVFIENHRSERYSTPRQTSAPQAASAPANKSASGEDASEKRACAGPTCGGKTLVARPGPNGPFWFCGECQGFTNKNKKGETYFRASTRTAKS